MVTMNHSDVAVKGPESIALDDVELAFECSDITYRWHWDVDPTDKIEIRAKRLTERWFRAVLWGVLDPGLYGSTITER